ncbi:hypothetical protein EYR36_010147, partial [Pleurotus pulmonarius]
MVARYTEGKAHTYYLNVIAAHEEKWTLEEYFRNIFDVCFPLNFRENQQKQLYRFRQDALTVKEYVTELTELIDLVGNISPQERVVKLFKGLGMDLQIAIRRRGLSPEVSSWEDVLEEALREESVQAALHSSSRAYNVLDRCNGNKDSSTGRNENHARRRAGDFRGRRDEQVSSARIAPSKGSGPPGMSANSVHIDFERHARLEAAARDVQPLESLSVGMVLMDSLLDNDTRASPSIGIAEALPEDVEQCANAEARTSWLNSDMDDFKLDIWRC